MSQNEVDPKKSIHQSEIEEEKPNRDDNGEEAQGENENKENEENEEKKEDEIKEKREPFDYFEEINNEIISDEDYFINEIGQTKYSICILMKDDENISSLLLYKTLKGIKLNLSSLNERLGINSESISIFIFINRIFNENIFNENDMNKLEENLQNEDNKFKFLVRTRIFKEDDELKNVKIYTIANKLEYLLYDVSALKLYYYFLSKLHKEKQIMFSSVITAGVFPIQDSLISLIQYSYHSKKKHSVSVASIEYKPNDLYSKISLYEKIHFNIYNMNFYNQSAAVPISSLLCTMTIDDTMIQFLNNFYNNEILENASIDYHDYNLGLKLLRANNRKCLIKYNYDMALGIIDNSEMTYFDYQKEWVNRYSGYYGNFFEILRTFVDCNICKFQEKLFLIFQLIAICIEFILPSLASMVIYTVFYEAFATYDYRIALFFTSLYLSMMFTSGVCSLISKDPSRMKMTNYFLYFFMEIFYLLVLICSVPAMHFVNINKIEDYISEYKFNKAAASILIIFSFIIYIIPMILKSSNIVSNIVPMILYFFLAAPLSTTNFNMAKIWNAPDTSGGNYISQRKSIYIIIYLCFNLFFGSLSFYNIGREKRVNCVMGLAILFLIYSFFRTLAIIINLVCNKEESFINEKLLLKIKNVLNNEEIDNEDVASEEKNIKNNKEEENNNNDYNNYEENHNNDTQDKNEGHNNSQNMSEKNNENEGEGE